LIEEEIMKHLTLVTIALLVVAVSASDAQTIERIDPFLFGGNDLNHVTTLDGGRLVAVGDASTITVSTDNGSTWSRKQVGGRDTILFTRIFWANTTIGLAVGHDGAAVRTTDGGDTWETLETNTHEHLLCGAYQSPTNVWAFGSNGFALRSTDGGSTWTSWDTKTFVDLQDATVLDDGSIIVVGQLGALGVVSADGTSLTLSATAPAPFHAVAFTDAQNGWVGTGGGVWHTTDAGASWTPVLSDVDGTIQHLYREPVSGALIASGSLAGEIFISQDGETWQSETIKDSLLVRATTISGNQIIAVGESGMAQRMTVGDDVWEGRVPPYSFLYDVAVAGATLVVVGGDGMVGGEGSVLIRAEASSWNHHAIAGAVRCTGVAVSSDGTTMHVSAQDGAIYRSTDGGQTWNALSVPATTPLAHLDAASDNVLWAGGLGTVYRTVDGTTWEAATSLGDDVHIFRVDAVSADRALVCGSDGMAALTTDGGTSWTHLNTGTDISFFDVREVGGIIHLVGQFGTYLWSSDDGASFQRSDLPVTTALRSIDIEQAADITIITTSDGSLVHNAGGMWEVVSVGTEHWSIVSAGNGVFYAVGEGGTVHEATFAVTSVQEEVATAENRLHPNPSTGTCTVSLDGLVGARSIRVFTTNGQLVSETGISAGESSVHLDLGAVTRGAYAVVVSTADGQLLYRSLLMIE